MCFDAQNDSSLYLVFELRLRSPFSAVVLLATCCAVYLCRVGSDCAGEPLLTLDNGSDAALDEHLKLIQCSLRPAAWRASPQRFWRRRWRLRRDSSTQKNTNGWR